MVQRQINNFELELIKIDHQVKDITNFSKIRNML